MNMEGASGSERQRGEPLMNPHAENLQYPDQQSLDSPGRKESLMESDGSSGPRVENIWSTFAFKYRRMTGNQRKRIKRKRTQQAKTLETDELAKLALRARLEHVYRSERDTGADLLCSGLGAPRWS